MKSIKDNSKQTNNTICENSILCCAISFIFLFCIYLMAFVLNVVLSLEAVKSSLVGNNYFIAILFTLLIIFAPEYIFSTVYLNLKENKKKNIFNVFSIMGIIFAISFSLISIWGTVETLYKITFGNVITSDKKISYENELSEYKARELALLNSIERTRDKILTMPVEYLTIRKQYENVLSKFQKELEKLETKKPNLVIDNTKDLSIVKIFDNLGIKINGVNFLSILLILGGFGLEIFLIMVSYNLFKTFSYLSIRFIKNKKKIKLQNNSIEDCIITNNIKFILSCLENDNLTIKPIRAIIKENGISKSKVLSILDSLKENNLILKNAKRLILHTELASKLVK